jgi:hypothetical protein
MQIVCGKQQTRRVQFSSVCARPPNVLDHLSANLIVRFMPVKEFANLGKEIRLTKEGGQKMPGNWSTGDHSRSAPG